MQWGRKFLRRTPVTSGSLVDGSISLHFFFCLLSTKDVTQNQMVEIQVNLEMFWKRKLRLDWSEFYLKAESL